jgi:hypothetical protein
MSERTTVAGMRVDKAELAVLSFIVILALGFVVGGAFWPVAGAVLAIGAVGLILSL